MVIVGPDGVGKTSVARALIRRHGGPSAYFHFRPRIGHPPPPAPPDDGGPPPPKNEIAGSRTLGWARLARSLVLFWVGYLTQVRPAVRRGTLAVADRWAYGYLVQPRALKFEGSPRLASIALRAFPRPDLVVNLAAPPETIRRRKQELSLEQIRFELDRWPELPAPRLRTFDASRPPDAIAGEIEEALRR